MSTQTKVPYMTPIQRRVLSSMYQSPQKGHTAKELDAKLNTLDALAERNVIVELNPSSGAKLLSERRRFRVQGAQVKVTKDILAS